MSFAFPKHEKLKSRKVIAQLFSEGKSISKFPVKMLYVPCDEAASERVQKATTSQAAFAVPKRNFKLAVARNGVKRQLREAFRLHKHLLSAESGRKFALLFLYLGKDKPQYAQLEASVQKLLEEMQKRLRVNI
jgi:ribonuclease P protein component